MGFAIDVFIGAVVALLFLWLCRLSARFERPVAAAGLVIAAAGYVGYGVIEHAALDLVVEFSGVGIFAILGALGAMTSAWFLAVGWALHAAWDLMVPSMANVSYMPGWYAAVCLGFDLVVATYFSARAAGAIDSRAAVVDSRAA